MIHIALHAAFWWSLLGLGIGLFWIGLSTSVGAGATVNVAAATILNNVGQASAIDLFMVADAALQTVQVLVTAGGQQSVPVAQSTPLNTAAGAGQGPKLDEDMLCSFAVPGGSVVQSNVTNGGGAAGIHRFRARGSP